MGKNLPERIILAILVWDFLKEWETFYLKVVKAMQAALVNMGLSCEVQSKRIKSMISAYHYIALLITGVAFVKQTQRRRKTIEVTYTKILFHGCLRSSKQRFKI